MPSKPSTSLARIVLPAALLALAGAIALRFDLPLATWFAEDNLPGWLRKLLQLSEVFGHGLGVVFILATLAILDPARRRFMPRLVAASLGAGLAADGLKLLLARTRPEFADVHAGVLATFQDWLPLLRNSYSQQSFPSAHVATATGLAIGLTWLYPRGREWFGFLTVLVALQRMAFGAHFLSDVCCGAAVGWLFAQCVVAGKIGQPMWNCFERPQLEVFDAPGDDAAA